MRFTFTHYPPAMKDLPPRVLMKAIEIANMLISERGYEVEKAVDTAIQRALRWAEGENRR